MTQATVRYIANGYVVQSAGGPAFPALLYAASIPEVVYWLGKVFDPLGTNAMVAQSAAAPKAAAAPRVVAADDPLLNQEAVVQDLENGGFLVRQQPSAVAPKMVDTWCASMDEVANVLTAIFTAPPLTSPPETGP